MRIKGIVVLALLAAVIASVAATVTGQGPKPLSPKTPVLSPAIPFAIPNSPNPNPVDFADFSWQSFIALMWPAAVSPSGVPIRGQANTSAKIGDAGVPVWETWKADWELFGASTNAPSAPQPTAWSDWNVNGGMNPCPTNTGGRTHMVVMLSKMDSVIAGVNQAMSGPLIDQNGKFIRYEMRVNQAEYDAIVANQWFVANNLPTVLTLPATSGSTYGSIELKAAWREMTAADDTSRYYTEPAVVLDLNGSGQTTCRQTTLGLVGFHIAHKLANRTEWIWSTFEQEDNVPEISPPPAGVRYSLNNGTTTPVTTDGFDWPPGDVGGKHKGPPKIVSGKPLPPNVPVQVTRYTPIPSWAASENAIFRAALAGTVWAHYKLTTAQWPTKQNGAGFDPSGTYPQNCGDPFPTDHVANTSAETYFQNNPVGSFGTSCMECHYQIAAVDFSWMINNEAWTGPSGTANVAALIARDISEVSARDLKRIALQKALEKKFITPSEVPAMQSKAQQPK